MERSRTGSQFNLRITRDQLLVWLSFGLFVLVAWQKYLAFRRTAPLVPSGDDAQIHFLYINYILEHGFPEAVYYNYPPGFHLLTAWLAKLTNLSSVDILHAWVILLIPLVMWAAYHFVFRIFEDRLAALMASLILGIFAIQPQQTIGDGGFPNVLAADVVMVIGVGYLYLALRDRNWLSGVVAVSSFFLTAIFHPISFVYFVILMSLLILIFLKQIVKTPRWSTKLIGGCIAVGLLAVVVYWPVYRQLVLPILTPLMSFFAPAGGEQAALTQSASTYVTEIQPPIPLKDYGVYLGQPVLWLGLLGAYLVLWRKVLPDRRAALFLLAWTGVFFWLSQTTFVHFPARFARELVIPFSMLGGIGLATMWRTFPWQIGKVVLLTLLILYCPVFLTRHQARALYPVPVIAPTEAGAIQWLQQNTRPGDTIILGVTTGYIGYLEYFLPGRVFYLLNAGTRSTLINSPPWIEWQDRCNAPRGSVYFFERISDSVGQVTEQDQLMHTFEAANGNHPTIRIFKRPSLIEVSTEANVCANPRRL